MRSKLKSARFWWAPDWLTLASGVLIVLSFPPFPFWPLIWIGLIPWFAAIHRAPSPKSAMIQGFWLSYFMSLGGFYWVAYVLQEFGNLPWMISILGLQLFCIFGQPQFFIFAPLLKILDAQHEGKEAGRALLSWKPLGRVLLLTSLYVGLDWILPKMFLDTLGHSFYKARNLRQLADLGGAHLLTFLVFFTNDALWRVWQNWKGKGGKLKLSPQLGLAGLLILLGTGYGFFRNQEVTEILSHSQQSLQAAAIQANIGDFDKIAAERGISGAATRIMDVFTSLSRQALELQPRPDVIIWPETSYPTTFRTPHSLLELRMDERLENFVRDIQTPLLFGGYDHRDGKDFNAFFVLSPNGNLQTYRKSILLIFGEYIPGAESIQWIKDTFPQVGNFGRGQGPTTLSIPTRNAGAPAVQAGPMICYEALFPSFTVDAARKGSQFLMNITNDSWFGKWSEPQLHLALSVFRSIESRLPMLRSTNTGISALILPNGEITNQTEVDTLKIMNVTVPITPPIPTLFKLWGDWFGLLCLALGFLSLWVLKPGLVRSALQQVPKIWSPRSIRSVEKAK